jgi:hypothetical protein
MKRFEEMTYYELLNVSQDASAFEIKQAYRETLAIYSENSLSTYTFFSEPERVRVLAKVELAFQTLLDDQKRLTYDKELVAQGKMSDSVLRSVRVKKAVPIFETDRNLGKDYLRRWVKTRLEEEEFKKRSEEIIGHETISGQDLKTIREASGMKIEELYELTRIGQAKLKALEEDLFAELPPEVYLKNFLKLYAEIFRLDPEKVVKGYLKHMAANPSALPVKSPKP